MKIQPMHDNIIVKVEDLSKGQTTKSGIFIPKTNSPQRPDKGEVVAVGEGRRLNNGTLIKSNIKIGDEIIFNKFSGTEIVSNDETYLVIKENDVMVKILKD